MERLTWFFTSVHLFWCNSWEALIGDFAYNMDENDGRTGDEFLRQIEPMAAYIPYMTAVGNHEVIQFTHWIQKFALERSEFHTLCQPIHHAGFGAQPILQVKHFSRFKLRYSALTSGRFTSLPSPQSFTSSQITAGSRWRTSGNGLLPTLRWCPTTWLHVSVTESKC